MKIRCEAGMTMGRTAPFFVSATTLAVISRERGTDRRFQCSYHQRLIQSQTLREGKYSQNLQRALQK